MTEPLNPRTIAQYIDHTLLKPEAAIDDGALRTAPP